MTAVVTGGVETNATCAGDPARWRETGAGIEKSAGVRGHHQHDAADQSYRSPTRRSRVRSSTMTEGKSAALQRLAVPSRQSSDLATGTGTDQYCVAAPLGMAKAR